jgi:multicomponent Na+:H+ antiporter subunit B
MFAYGIKETQWLLRIHPGYLMPFGLSLAILSGIVPVIFTGQPFLTGIWFDDPIPVIGLVGTALFFDIGVYIVVVGVTLTILFTISEGN